MAGQVCLAAKRFILLEKIADRFEHLFVEAARSIRVGDPFDPAMQMGPMSRTDLRDLLHQQVEGSVAKGARVLCGGKPLPGKIARDLDTGGVFINGVTASDPRVPVGDVKTN